MKQWVAVFVAAFVCVATLVADEAPELKSLSGTWSKQAGEFEVEFAFKGEKLAISLKRGSDKLILDSDVAVSRDGRVFGRVAVVTEDGIAGGGDKGELFTFNATVSGKSVTVSELRGTNVSDDARKLVEGEFKKK